MLPTRGRYALTSQNLVPTCTNGLARLKLVRGGEEALDSPCGQEQQGHYSPSPRHLRPKLLFSTSTGSRSLSPKSTQTPAPIGTP